MSHFTVAVITDSIDKLEEMLAPYDENIEVEPYISKTKKEIIENAKERKEKFLNELKEKGLNHTDDNWKQKYIDAKTEEELYRVEIDEYEKYDEEGNELSTYNPNSKWDWYTIGGRWRNLLLTKIDNKNVIQETGLEDLINGGSNLTKKAPEGYKWVDGAKIKDIDFGKATEFNNTYNKAIRFWETYIEGQEPQTEGEKEAIKWELYKKEYYIDRYENKENYARFESTFCCFALLDETGWHEKGEMGWFGVSNDTKESELAFVEKFTEIINKPENQDKYLIVVDCHI